MKQLMNWTKARIKKLNAFYKLQGEYGTVSMSQLAEELGKTVASAHDFRLYCLKNGIIQKAVAGRYEITEFGKSLLEN